MIAWVFWLVGLLAVVDAVRHSEALWVAAERNKGFWITLMVFTGGLGAVMYVLALRPRLERVAIDDSFLDPNPWANLTSRISTLAGHLTTNDR